QHAALQTAREYAGNAAAFVGGSGFLLDDGGQNERLVGRVDGNVGLRALCPGFVQIVLHGIVGAPVDGQVGGAAAEEVGIRHEAAFGVFIGVLQRRHDGGGVAVLQFVIERLMAVDGGAHLIEGPAVDQRDVVAHGVAG